MRATARLERANTLVESFTKREQKARSRSVPSPVVTGVVATVLAEAFPRAAWAVDVSLRTPKDTDAPIAGVVTPVAPTSTVARDHIVGCSVRGEVDIFIEVTDDIYRLPSSDKIMAALNASPHVLYCDAGVTGGGSDDNLDMQLSVQVVEETIPAFDPKPLNGWKPDLHLSGPALIDAVDRYVSVGRAVRLASDAAGRQNFQTKSGAAFILWSIPGVDSTPGAKNGMNANSKITTSTPDAEGVVTITRETKVSVITTGDWDFQRIMGVARDEANKIVGGYNAHFGKIESVEFIERAPQGHVTIVETFLHRPKTATV